MESDVQKRDFGFVKECFEWFHAFRTPLDGIPTQLPIVTFLTWLYVKPVSNLANF
jgi:hypothetical protein